MLRTLLIPILFLLTPLIGAQDPFESPDRLTVKAHFEPATAAPGDEVTLIIEGDIEAGYHIYGALDGNGNPTTVTLLKTRGLTPKGEAVVPIGKRHDSYGIESFWIEHKLKITQKFTVPSGIATGVLEVSGEIDYMACTVESCDPAGMAPFVGKLEIKGGAANAVAAAPSTSEDSAAAEDFGMQDPFGMDEQKVSFELRFEPATARAGEKVTLHIKTTVIPEWHVYGALDENPITFTLDATKGLTEVGTILVPEGHRHAITEDFVNFWVEGEFEVTQTFTVGSDVKPGTIDLKGLVEYMACDLNSCDPPGEEALAATLTIEAGEARAAHLLTAADKESAPPTKPAQQDSEKDEDAKSLWSLIWLCVGGGIFALVMPCTYPMIPITFSFFTKQAESRGGNVMGLALIYGAGIILMFALIGLVVGVVAKGADAAIIDLANNWILNIFLGGMFVFFAFVLFGMINLQPPRFLMNTAGKASSAGGLMGVFLMGATLVITSFTCTAPIVGGVLANEIGRPVYEMVIGMGVFGLTMALPFVFLALTPGKMKAIPKAGGWMNTLKVVLGFVELAAAVKFFSVVDVSLNLEILPREMFLLIWAAIFAMTTIFLLANPTPGKDKPGFSRIVAGAAFCAFTIYSLFGSMGYSLQEDLEGFVAPYSAPTVHARGSAHDGPKTMVEDDYPEAVKLAKVDEKLILLNFTGKN